MTGKTRHVSVLEKEVIDWIGARQGGCFLDCTLGGGGHTAAILAAHDETFVVGIDRDKRAIERARRTLERWGNRVTLCHAAFSDLQQTEELSGKSFNGIIADLGVSTDQLFEERGFSFRESAALDMRMDESSNATAFDVVNRYAERELFIVLKTGGVGSDAQRIAHSIVQNRPVEDTATLASIVANASSRATRSKGVHPATVAFQAIRMEVNQEVQQIEALLAKVPSLIEQGGRLVVISFHSLEDKIVARTMRRWEGETSPANWRGAGENTPGIGRLLTRKAVVPSAEEIAANPAARSARMRVFEFSGVVRSTQV